MVVPMEGLAHSQGPAQNSEFKARYADVPLAEWLRAISLATVEG
jgi:hypothetical protein